MARRRVPSQRVEQPSILGKVDRETDHWTKRIEALADIKLLVVALSFTGSHVVNDHRSPGPVKSDYGESLLVQLPDIVPSILLRNSQPSLSDDYTQLTLIVRTRSHIRVRVDRLASRDNR